MRSGCLGLLFALGVRVLSTVLVAVGAALLLFGVLAFDPSPDVRMVVALVVAPVGAYLFYRVGREVWRDLKAGPRKPERDEGNRRPPDG